MYDTFQRWTEEEVAGLDAKPKTKKGARHPRRSRYGTRSANFKRIRLQSSSCLPLVWRNRIAGARRGSHNPTYSNTFAEKWHACHKIISAKQRLRGVSPDARPAGLTPL